MFTPRRAAQFGLAAVAVVLVLCMGVLIANGNGASRAIPTRSDSPVKLEASSGSEEARGTDSTSIAQR